MTDDTLNEALTISRSGLWTNNVALVQLLGLCPLLAVTGTVINGLGLGIATLITLVLSNSKTEMKSKECNAGDPLETPGGLYRGPPSNENRNCVGSFPF